METTRSFSVKFEKSIFTSVERINVRLDDGGNLDSLQPWYSNKQILQKAENS